MRVKTRDLMLHCAESATGTRIIVDVPSSVPPDPAKLVQEMLVAQCVGQCALHYYLQRGLAHETTDIQANWEQLSQPVGACVLQVTVALPTSIPVSERQVVMREMQTLLSACQPVVQNRSEVVVIADPS
jgi:hypothetical protein